MSLAKNIPGWDINLTLTQNKNKLGLDDVNKKITKIVKE
jgi:hypothetical protein